MQGALKKSGFRDDELELDLMGVLLSESDDLIFAKDNEFRIIYANRKFLELYPPEQRDHIIGKTTAENFSETQRLVFFAEDRKALEEGRSQLIENITDYTGKVRTFHTQKMRFYDRSGKRCMLGICTDISQMALRERQLAEANMSLENFAKTAAHDLRSPLGTLLFALDMLKMDKQTTLGPVAENYIHMMKTCVSGLADQISGMLEIQQRTEETSQFTSCDVKILFEEAKFNLSKLIKDTKASVLCTDLPVMTANRHMLRQLIQNLIENSLKYRSKDIPIIILRCEQEPDYCLFSIEDNGIGISDDDKDRMFGIFERVRNDGKITGCGIGLSLCRQIVDIHGGRIWFDREKRGSGCKINFKLPYYQPAK